MRTALRSAGFGQQPDPTVTFHLTIDPDTLVYAVGDVHGSLYELRELEDRIVADAHAFSGRKTIVMLGDYVDRGLSSAGVIEHLRRPPPDGFERICLRGNHEQLFADFLDNPAAHGDWLRIGGRETLESYGLEVPERVRRRSDLKALGDLARQAVPAEHVTFLRQLPLTARHGRIVYVHAGLRPGVAPERQTLEDLLFMVDHPDGPMGPAGMRVVHGHVASLVPLVREHRICIDTGAYRTGVLTAARVDDGEVGFLKSTDPLRPTAPALVDVPEAPPLGKPPTPFDALASEPPGSTGPAAEPERPRPAIRFLPEPSADSLPDPTQGHQPARRFRLAAGLGSLAAIFAALWLTDVDAHFLTTLLNRPATVETAAPVPRAPAPAEVAALAPEPEPRREPPTGSISGTSGDSTPPESLRTVEEHGPDWAGLADRIAPATEPPAPIEMAAIAPVDPIQVKEDPASAVVAAYPPLPPPSRPILPHDAAVRQTAMASERLAEIDPPTVAKQRPAQVRNKKPKRPRVAIVRAAPRVVEERRRSWTLFGLLSPRDAEAEPWRRGSGAGGGPERRASSAAASPGASTADERQAAPSGKAGKSSNKPGKGSGRSAGAGSGPASSGSSADRGGLIGGVAGALSGVGDRLSGALGGRSGRSGKDGGGERGGGRGGGKNSRDD